MDALACSKAKKNSSESISFALRPAKSESNLGMDMRKKEECISSVLYGRDESIKWCRYSVTDYLFGLLTFPNIGTERLHGQYVCKHMHITVN